MSHDVPMVAGLYRRGIVESISFACLPLGADMVAPAGPGGLMELGGVATGFLSIERAVFAAVEAASPRYHLPEG